MKIGLAQIKPATGDIERNIKKHLKLINEAVRGNADAIFFPELSLTGYEPKLAKPFHINEEDDRLDKFQKISDSKNITIGLGFPKRVPKGTQISMLIFQPNSPRQSYSKQYLHPDELPYFINGVGQLLIEVKGIKIAPAICFEALQSSHIENTLRMGAEIYLASVAKAANGVSNASVYFAEVSKKYKLSVLMVNSIGYCDNFLSAGNTSVWNEKGILMASLDKHYESLLIVDLLTNEILKHEIS